MMEERALATYEVVRLFWRTTEAFDTVRGKMPPDGVFLKDGHAYFVSHSIAVRVPIPIQKVDLFVRPDLKARDDGWGQEEDLLARTERGHPYADLGPRPHHYRRLFPGKGATFKEVTQVFETEGVTFPLRLDHDTIRHYLAETAGPRGNGRSGYLAVSGGDPLVGRYVFTPKQGAAHVAEATVAIGRGGVWEGSAGVSPYALLYALRFLGEEVVATVAHDRISLKDETNGAVVVLATRPVSSIDKEAST